jgi:2-amino-4-hydroxy-6-hydroxymethyldihydropteridine diphosphokinase
VTAIPDDAVVIGLGGNVGGDAAILERFVRAREALAQLGEVRSAALYRTAPIVRADPTRPSAVDARLVQPPFLNSAVRVRWRDATASEVIDTVLEIERLLGRDRRGEPRWGPRTIDLDVLVWGTRVIRTGKLEVPHPRLVERRFALQPLVDLFGEDAVVPGTPEPLGALVSRVADQPLEQLQSAW